MKRNSSDRFAASKPIWSKNPFSTRRTISRRGPRYSQMLSAQDEKNADGDPDGSAKHRVEIARQVQYELYVIGAVARRVYNVLFEGKNLRLTDSFMRDRCRRSAQCGKISVQARC